MALAAAQGQDEGEGEGEDRPAGCGTAKHRTRSSRSAAARWSVMPSTSSESSTGVPTLMTCGSGGYDGIPATMG